MAEPAITSLETFKEQKIKKKKLHRGFFSELVKNKVLFLLMVPGLLVLLVNNYIPITGLVLAFREFSVEKGYWGSVLNGEWQGTHNFDYLFSSQDAFNITFNTLTYNAIFILISITLAVLLALVLNEIRNKTLAKFYQSVFFLPYFLSWVVVSYLVFSLLSSDMGLLNKSVLSALGMQPIDWYTEPKYWRFILVTVNTWKWTGYDSVIYLAAIVGFDKSLYEAAAVDGASRLQQLRHITLPLLIPVITILTLMKIGRMFNADFGLFFNIPRNSGILSDTTDVIDTYVYRALIQTNDIGMAAAGGFYQSICGFILVLTANFVVRKIDKENALF